MAAISTTQTAMRGSSGHDGGSFGLRPLNWLTIAACIAAVLNLGRATVAIDQLLAAADAAGTAPDAALAGAAAFATSLARCSLTFIWKFETRRVSRGLSWTDAAVISPSSGFTIHGLLEPRLRSSSDTRSLDCAMPEMTTTWFSCFMLVR